MSQSNHVRLLPSADLLNPSKLLMNERCRQHVCSELSARPSIISVLIIIDKSLVAMSHQDSHEEEKKEDSKPGEVHNALEKLIKLDRRNCTFDFHDELHK